MSALSTTVNILICQMLDTDKASGRHEIFIQKSFQKSIANKRADAPRAGEQEWI